MVNLCEISILAEANLFDRFIKYKVLSMIYLLRLLIVSFLAFVLLSCSSPKYLTHDEIKKVVGIEKFPDKSQFPESDAVMIYESLEVKDVPHTLLRWGVTKQFKVHTLSKIFKNTEDFMKESYSFERDEKFLEFEAKIYKPDGTIKVVNQDDLLTGNLSVGDKKYNDHVSQITYPGLENDCLIEKTYIKEFHNWGFDYNIQEVDMPKLYSTFKVVPNAPVDWAINLADVEGNKDPKYEKNGVMIWTFRNIPVYKPEKDMPPTNEYYARVMFNSSSLFTWQNLIDAYYNVFLKDQLQESEIVKQKASDLTKECKNEVEKIEALYKYVREINYDAFELGERGLTPEFPEEVIRKEHGDCKDKSILLHSLLNTQGIKSIPVLVLTNNKGIIRKEKPDFRFNHMILCVKKSDGQNVFVDPTCTFCPLGQVPHVDEGIDVLMLLPDGNGGFQFIKENDYKKNLSDYSCYVKFDSSGEAEFNINIKYTGHHNYFMRELVYRLEYEDMNKYIKSLIFKDFVNSDIYDIEFSNLYDGKDTFTIAFKFKSINCIQNQGDLFFMSFDPVFVAPSPDWLLAQERKYPIQNDFPFIKKKETIIEIPKGLELKSLPEAFSANTDDYYYKRFFLKQGFDRIVVKEEFNLKNKYIPPENFKGTKDFYNKVNTKINEKIIMQSKATQAQ